MRQPLMFKLDQNPEGSGLRCDSGGLFLGRDALLKRDRNGKFEARPVAEFQAIFGRAYREESNWESRIRSVHLIADALNKGDIARAMMTAVLMRLPDPAEVTADTEGVLAKANFNPDEPRDERGRWTSDGSTDTEQSQTNPHQNMWQMFGLELSDGAKALLSRMGRAQIAVRDAELTAATTARNVIANWLSELATYRAKPWIGPTGKPIQVPLISSGDPFSNQAALITHELFEPSAPLMRPGTNADWIDPLITLTSAGAVAAGGIIGAGASAGVLEGGGAEALSESAEDYAEGSFSIRDWSGYPANLSRPNGPFRLLDGDEYDAARSAANGANRALREADPEAYAGREIHEIQPVKFDGSPTDPANKIALAPQEHSIVTTWWARLMRSLPK